MIGSTIQILAPARYTHTDIVIGRCILSQHSPRKVNNSQLLVRY
jgi:aspartyl aminopeptidase